MASPTVYDVVIPTFTKGLQAFDHILTRAEQHAAEQARDPNAEFAQARLVADQNPLVFQLQNATKIVKLTLGRLGQPSQPWTDGEQTFDDLHQRIRDALDLLGSVDPSVINAHAAQQIDLPFAGKVLKVSAASAALTHGIPNFYFHLVTGYSILRSKGVPLGKADYISSFLGV